MNEPLSTEPYKGVRDFYPEDWALFQSVLEKVHRTLRSWGYEEYNASPLESSILYEKKTSEEIVNEQTYTFEDRGGRRVTLRPEMTPTLARMVAARQKQLYFPIRWYSIGNRFRYERPQKGRLREFYQVDVDCIGLGEGEADIEVITLADEMMKTFGATGSEYVIRVNSRTLLTKACEAAGLDSDRTKTYMRLLDKKAKLPAAEFAVGVREIIEIDPLSLIEANDSRIETERAHVLSLIETLKARGVSAAIFDPTLTRGFDYYTGVTFEVFDTNPENPRALLGGGRYDRLLALFGGDPIPAIGFAFGDVTFIDFLRTHNLLPEPNVRPDIYLATPTPEDRPRAAEFAKSLRAEGMKVFTNLTERPLKDQVRDAVRRNIPYLIAYGAEEAASGQVRLKALATGVEQLVEARDIAEYISAL